MLWLFFAAGCEALVTPGAVNPEQKPMTPDGPVITEPQPPGKCEPAKQEVTKLLRLSNHEYRAMVNDVLGVQVDPALFAQWTPVAEVYGFDTMSETRIDGQGLQVQLATAEKLAQLVLNTPAFTQHCPSVGQTETPACNLKPTYTAIDDFADTQGRECWSYLDSSGAMMTFNIGGSFWQRAGEDGCRLSREGAHPGGTTDVIRRWQVPVTGKVRLTGNFVDVDPGGGDGVLVTIRHNGTQVWTRDLPNAGQTTYDQPLDVTRGDQIDFVVNRKGNTAYDTTGFTASVVMTPTPSKASWNWGSCVEPLVSRLGSRAFRRPIRAEELAQYQTLFNSELQAATAAGFPQPVDLAMEAVLQSLFMSPNFVFKPELVPNGLDASERAFGTASRLSLFTRGSIADEALWMTAGTGALNTPEQIRAEATRLLDQDLDRFSTHFAGQWLAFRDPFAEGALYASMQKESHDVFAAVLRDGLAPEDLLSPGFTVVDRTMAGHYWLPDPADGIAPPWRIVSDKRGGLLSQAAFLTRTGSGSEFRRPIHRGLWVLTRLMCFHLPRIDAATLEEINMSVGSIDRSLPLKEQMKLHRDSSSRCNSCHGSIDPIGLALENYDPMGNWRDRDEHGHVIESDLQLKGQTVRNPMELAAVLEDSEEYRTCVSEKLLTFALNRGPLDGERCVVERLGRPIDGTKPTLKEMTVDALMTGMSQTEVSP
ncbi:MAG: DUF1588 domain-containing protein [Archangium sp.]